MACLKFCNMDERKFKFIEYDFLSYIDLPSDIKALVAFMIVTIAKEKNTPFSVKIKLENK